MTRKVCVIGSAKDPEESRKYPTCMSDESSSADPRLDMCDREQHLVLSVCRYNASALMSRCPACGSSEPLTAAVATLRARGRRTLELRGTKLSIL